MLCQLELKQCEAQNTCHWKTEPVGMVAHTFNPTQADLYEFEDSLLYMVSSSIAKTLKT